MNENKELLLVQEITSNHGKLVYVMKQMDLVNGLMGKLDCTCEEAAKIVIALEKEGLIISTGVYVFCEVPDLFEEVKEVLSEMDRTGQKYLVQIANKLKKAKAEFHNDSDSFLSKKKSDLDEFIEEVREAFKK